MAEALSLTGLVMAAPGRAGVLKAGGHKHTIPAKDLLEIGWKPVQLMPPQVYQQVLADG